MSETHIDRKELKSPDAFFLGVGSVNRFLQENRAVAIGGVLAVVLLFGGAVAWRAQGRRSAENAAAAFLRATDAVEESSFESARSALGAVAAENREPYGSLASLYLAELDLKAGNADAAAAAYGVAAKELNRDYLKQAALVGRAFALETAGKPADAAKAYAEASSVASTYKESALRAQLRTAKSAGDSGLVKAALKGLVEGYPEGADADALSSELASLGG
jgi:predicted negative regulator of RcsB-dependent stress response